MLTARTLWESMLSCSELELHLKAYYDSTGQYCPPEQYPRISGHAWEVLPESGTSRSHMAASPMLSELPEDLYFRNSLQVRILRHFRYMYTPDHSHAFFEMIYVLKGSCSNQVDGLGLPLSEGDICIIPPGHPLHRGGRGGGDPERSAESLHLYGDLFLSSEKHQHSF